MRAIKAREASTREAEGTGALLAPMALGPTMDFIKLLRRRTGRFVRNVSVTGVVLRGIH